MNQTLASRVFYQIYPPSFYDSNADGIGDIPGIIEKLDYIAEMGFGGIWLNPCFRSPFMDGGYDVEDFYTVAPRYGTNEDLKRLFAQAHARDILVLLDLVPCHTATTCEWFRRSMRAERNEYTGRYLWTDSIGTDFSAVKGVTGTLRGISERNGNCAVSYFSTQPALNYGYADCREAWQQGVDSPDAVATQQELLNIMRFWLGMGCDGFRVDMAAFLVKNDDDDHRATIALWRRLLSTIRREFPKAVFVSEWSEPEKAIEAGFDMDFVLGAAMHASDLWRTEKPYFSAEASGNAEEFWEAWQAEYEKTAGRGFMCFSSGNHDNLRYTEMTQANQHALVMTFLMTMPGVPFVYYGDEIAMRYLSTLTSIEGGYHRTGSRTPMQWNGTTNSGFSAASADKLYLPIDPQPDRPTVCVQLQQKDSLLRQVQKLIALRKAHPALWADGGFARLSDGSVHPMIFTRQSAEETLLVVINPAQKPHTFALPEKLVGLTELYVCGQGAREDGGVLTVLPQSAAVFRIGAFS